jgi:lipopolysaccharide transport system ATP-binding protein
MSYEPRQMPQEVHAMNSPVISIEGISKAYQIYQKPSDMMLEVLGGKKRHDLFWALRNVSLDVHEHDRIGIIGANGSGKSTLLKIIAGNLEPSTGRVTVHGKISAMLSLATSLNPEETGLSNIRFNLMLNGCPKSKIAELVDEIIDFTELGPFIYQPVKTYSAGMNAKLAFAIATSIDPEILIVDEVLSVGDAYFVGKAMKRMVDLCKRGKALLFVSHSTTAVQMLCNKVIWMENGSVRMAGRVDQILKIYEEDARRSEDEATRALNVEKSRERLQGKQLSEQDLIQSLWLVRLNHGTGAKHNAATYYVRNVAVSIQGGDFVDIPLEHAVTTRVGGLDVRVDLLDSAWGRLYEKDGFACRILSPRTGKAQGGRIVFDHPEGESGHYSVRIKAQFHVEGGQAPLVLEKADLDKASWTATDDETVTPLDGGWYELVSAVAFDVVRPEQLAQARRHLENLLKPAVDILRIEVHARNQIATVIDERNAFEIRVTVLARRRIARADVGINIYRADGVYVFWQSSGLADVELRDFAGEATLVFAFEANPFAAGDYLVGAYCGNGWDPVTNFPHSEIFTQKVNEARFQIKSEYGAVAFGLVNARVNVRIVDEKPPTD